MKRYIFPIIILFLSLPGCLKKDKDKDNGGGGGDADSPAPKTGFFSSKQYAPGYGWDGQTSSGNIDAPLDVVYARTNDVLRAMKFKMNEEDAHLQATSAKIQGAKEDHTTVQVILESKTSGQTSAKVKVGTVGDRTGGEHVLDEIQKAAARKKRKYQ